jgi:hypothetical protein
MSARAQPFAFLSRRTLARAARAHVVFVLFGAALGSGCLFLPGLERHGYTACASDLDCPPARYCGEGLCAPPPWHDDQFNDRRVLLVKNQDTQPLPRGTAVPVVIGGEDGLLSLADVGPDLRFSDFDRASDRWRVVPVFLDRESDRFTAWIPTQRELAQGKTDVLAWIESDTPDRLPSVVEDPSATFAAFDTFDLASEQGALDPTLWRVTATGGAPTVDRGLVNVADNQSIVLRQSFAPPAHLSLRARVNGVTCDEVFLGFIGDEQSRFPVGPGAGVFVARDLAGAVLVAPSADSVPASVANLAVRNAFARYDITVDENALRVSIDGVLVYEDLDLRPPFSGGRMHPAVLVGGACSVDVDSLWVTPLPLPAPVVSAGDLVQFQLF